MTRTELYITVSKQSNKSMNYDDANELVQDYMELIPSDLVLRKASEETKLFLLRLEIHFLLFEFLKEDFLLSL